MKHTVTVPVTTYKEVEVTREQLIDMLKKEAKSLCNGYESIVLRNGSHVYYIAGYGSHDIGEKYGPEAPVDIVKAYENLWETILFLMDKDKKNG